MGASPHQLYTNVRVGWVAVRSTIGGAFLFGVEVRTIACKVHSEKTHLRHFLISWDDKYQSCLGWYVQLVNTWFVLCIWCILGSWRTGILGEGCLCLGVLLGIGSYMAKSVGCYLCVFVVCNLGVVQKFFVVAFLVVGQRVDLCVWFQLLSFTASPRSCVRRHRFFKLITAHIHRMLCMCAVGAYITD